MDAAEVKQYILNYRLPENPSMNEKYTRVLLQLFGYAGHGKSAFVNSCIYTLGTGAFRVHAQTGSSGNIITTKRNAYKLTDTITIVDNRGFGRKIGAEEAVVYAQLGHFLPLNEDVKPINNFLHIMSQVEDSDLTPNYTDFIVPIFVYSAKNVMPEQQVEEVRTFCKNCRDMTGVVPIVVLTHKSHRNYEDLVGKFKRVEAEQVLAVENYTREDNLKTRGRCTDIQGVIMNALKDVEFRLQHLPEPITERIKRKKFLLTFVYNFTLRDVVTETTEKAKQQAKKEEFDRLKNLADKNWFGKFPYDKSP